MFIWVGFGKEPAKTRAKCEAVHSSIVNSYWPAVIGFFLGFGFGVGCALAVMYSIYMGGYRAAVRDSQLPNPPERYIRALQKNSAAS
jgi:ABC-type nitrate/sulfonate/bicarbonate transport system permease component